MDFLGLANLMMLSKALDNIKAGYGDINVLHSVSLKLHAGGRELVTGYAEALNLRAAVASPSTARRCERRRGWLAAGPPH